MVRGAALLVAAMAAFAVSDVMAKRLLEVHSPITVAWIRYLLLLVTVVPLAMVRPGSWRTRCPWLQAGRAAGLVGSAVLFQFAIRAMPVAEATAMVFASPLFVTLLAMLVLREAVPWRRWLPVILGFAGVLVVVRPGVLGFGGAEIFPLLSSMAWAVAVVCTRRLSDTDNSTTTMLYSGLFGVAGLTLMLPDLDLRALPGQAILLVPMAAAWCAAQWLTIAAYRLAPAASIAPFAYSQLVWAAVLGYAVFRHVPDAVALCGMAVILASGLCAAWQGRRARA